MLVLSRKKYEAIIIHRGKEIIATVRVTDIRGDKVRIGIDADDSITINREEIFAEIHPGVDVKPPR